MTGGNAKPDLHYIVHRYKTKLEKQSSLAKPNQHMAYVYCWRLGSWSTLSRQVHLCHVPNDKTYYSNVE